MTCTQVINIQALQNTEVLPQASEEKCFYHFYMTRYNQTD